MHRPKNWIKLTDGFDLPTIASIIHALITGSSDYRWNKRFQYMEALQYAEANWKEGSSSTKRYDDAVREQIRAVIEEWKLSEIKER